MHTGIRQLWMIVVATALLALALVFNAWLMFTTLGNEFDHSVADRYRLLSLDLHRDLVSDARFTRGLTASSATQARLEGLRDELLIHLRARVGASDEAAVAITGSDGRILATTNAGAGAGHWPEAVRVKLLEQREAEAHGSSWDYVRGTQELFVIMPLTELGGGLAGSLVVELRGPGVWANSDRFFSALQRLVTLIILAGIALLVVAVRRYMVLVGETRRRGRGRGAGALLVVALAGTQLLSSCVTVFAFNIEYLQLNRARAEVLTSSFKDEVEPVLNLGIRIEHIADLEALLREHLAEHPETVEARVSLLSGETVAYAARDEGPSVSPVGFGAAVARAVRATSSGDGYEVRDKIQSGGRTVATISARVSGGALREGIFEIGADVLTVFVIALLLTGEILVLTKHYVERGARRLVNRAEEPPVHFRAIRPAIFFFLFGIDISMSFVPLHMEKLYVPVLGLSEDFVMGLPISVEFMFVGLCILLAGGWLDRRGWHEPFLVGVGLAGVGVLYSSFAPDWGHFIASRALVGMGFGLTLMAAQGFVIHNTDSRSKAQGLAHLFAGLYAGSLCGSAVGAMLADRVSYEAVFALGGVVLLAVLAYVVLFMRPTFGRPEVAMARGGRQAVGSALRRFLTDRRVLSVMLLASFPSAIVVVGVVNYYVPVFLNRLGSSQTTIGQVLLTYGLCLVLFGPAVGRLVDRTGERRLSIVVGSLLGAAALFAFTFMDGLMAALAAVVLLGLSSALILAAQSAYLLSLPAARALGDGKAIGIFRASSRIGQVLGPVIFAVVVSLANIGGGLAVLGVLYVVVSLLFALTSRAPDSGAVTQASIGEPAPEAG